MQLLAQGKEDALNRLMERHSDRLFQFLIRELQNEEDAADLAQEAFVRVFQHRQRYDPAHKFTTWLYTIAVNLVRDRYRWRSRHPDLATAPAEQRARTEALGQVHDAAPIPGERLQREERAEAVRRAVAELPDELRAPLILAQYQGLGHGEIGQVLGCSRKAVEMRIYRARQQLRERLGPLLGDG